MDTDKTDVQLIPSHPTKNACSSGFLAFLQHLPDQSYCTCLLSSHYLLGRSAAAHGAIFGAEMSFLFPTSVSSRWHLRRNEDTSKHTNHSSGPALGRILVAATSHWFDPTRCKVREKIFSWPAFYDWLIIEESQWQRMKITFLDLEHSQKGAFLIDWYCRYDRRAVHITPCTGTVLPCTQRRLGV